MDRISNLRSSMLRAEHARNRVVMPANLSALGLADSLAERRAHGLRLLLESMPVVIEPHELIVGSRTLYGAPSDDSNLEEKSSQKLHLHAFPVTMCEDETKVPHRGPILSHNVGGYVSVLSHGFGGVKRNAQKRLSEEKVRSKCDFLRSVCIVFEAATAFVRRYATLASSMVEPASGQRKADLRGIARVCNHIATDPPTNLQEALQLCWFTHLVLMIENFILMSLGRFDQYIAPFWDTCSSDEAQELIDCFLIKANDQFDIWFGEGNTSNNLMLSGLRPDGGDSTNEVTYACLDSFDRLRMPEPIFAVRLHKHSPPKLVHRLASLASRGNMGQVAIYNDDVFVPGLIRGGLPPEAARDYALDACQDVIIPGCSRFYSSGQVPMTSTLIDTLASIPPNAAYSAVVASYKKHLTVIVRETAGRIRKDHDSTTLCRSIAMPFTSGTMDDCIHRGQDMIEGGLRYQQKGIMITSPVNAINSLAAIRKVVYDERRATLLEVQTACAANFEGYEPIRQQLLAAPKWGNDDDYVDQIACDILKFVSFEIQKEKLDATTPILSGVHQAHHVRNGKNVGATPDGRKAGGAYPVTLSPANGTDRNGATAVLRSMTKLDPMVFQWNGALSLTLHPSALMGTKGIAAFETLLRTYIALRGVQLQTNIIDADTLRDAQQDPENYRDLTIRVWGFNARFLDLSHEYQEDLIARTTHF